MVVSLFAGIDGQSLNKELDSSFVLYIADTVERWENSVINTDTMIRNLSAAIILQYSLMEQAGNKFREESARHVNSFQRYSGIKKLTALICISFFKGKNKLCELLLEVFEK